MTNTARYLTACHEAGHALAYLTYGVYPDGMDLYDDESGMVHRRSFHGYLEIAAAHDELSRQEALFSLAGPVAELMAKGADVEYGEIIGSSIDLNTAITFCPDNEDRFLLQQEAARIINSNHRLWLVLARLLCDLGHVPRDDLVMLWHRYRELD